MGTLSDCLGIDAPGLLWRINVGDVRSRSSVLLLILGTLTDKFASREGWSGTEIVAFFYHGFTRRHDVRRLWLRLIDWPQGEQLETSK